MKPSNLIRLDVLRAKQESPHVIVEIHLWHLGGRKWWTEPETRSRVGEPTAVGWEVIARTVEEYGRELRHYGCPTPTGRKVKARRKRWR